MVKYLGSKRVLLPRIVSIFDNIPGVREVADLFSGTARVGHALKSAGFVVHASDNLRFAAHLARCYVAADADVWRREAEGLIAHLNGATPESGDFTQVYCREARFFQPHNGEKIEGVRREIQRLCLPAELESIALVSLMEAADRVDSTTGLQMAYLKDWAPRAHGNLCLRVPALLPGKGYAREGNAEDIAGAVRADAAYLDPPYNQHSYLANYHIWETLCRWDRPATYGVARKRADVRERKSRFNSKRGIRDALREVIHALSCPWIVLSFNNEGYLDEGDIREMLADRGHVAVASLPYKRYVGAQIGIHNPDGVKVGAVSHLRNREMLFVAGPDRAVVERCVHAARAEGRW